MLPESYFPFRAASGRRRRRDQPAAAVRREGERAGRADVPGHCKARAAADAARAAGDQQVPHVHAAVPARGDGGIFYTSIIYFIIIIIDNNNNNNNKK